MRNLIVIIVLFSLSFTSCSSQDTNLTRKYFEGEIQYEVSFRLKQPDLDTFYLRRLIGYSSTFLFKEGNYKQIFDLENLQEEIYHKDDNKSYFKRNRADSFYWKIMTAKNEKKLKFNLVKHKERILNIECDEITVEYPNKIKRYYFNSDTLRINPTWFANFSYYDKAFIMGKMKSLFIKCELEYDQFVVIFTAVSIKNIKIDDKIFNLPNRAILSEEK